MPVTAKMIATGSWNALKSVTGPRSASFCSEPMFTAKKKTGTTSAGTIASGSRGIARIARPAIERVSFKEPLSPFMSTVTARVESAQRMGPLLVDQLTAPVRFTQATTELMREGVRTFVEVGPGNVLSGLVKRIDRSVKAISVNDLASLDKLHEALSKA